MNRRKQTSERNQSAMRGRYALRTPLKDLLKLFDLDPPLPDSEKAGITASWRSSRARSSPPRPTLACKICTRGCQRSSNRRITGDGSKGAKVAARCDGCQPPYPVDKMELHPVSTLVNSPHHEGPECVGKGRAGSIRAGRQILAPGDCAHGPLAHLSGPIGLERSPQISIFLSPHGPGRYAETARASRKTMLANAFERGPLNRMGG